MQIVLKYLNDIRSQVKQLPREVRRSLGIIVVMLFLLLGSYPFIRVAAEAFFNLAYGSQGLPAVWIGAVVVLSISMLIYNRLQNCFTAQKLYLFTMLVTVLFFLACIPGVTGQSKAFFIYHFYMWKEVYIILLLHMAFCYFNTLFTLPVAKLLYGPLGAVMGIAGWVGSLLVKLDHSNGIASATLIGTSMVVLSGLLFLLLPPRPLTSFIHDHDPACAPSTSAMPEKGGLRQWLDHARENLNFQRGKIAPVPQGPRFPSPLKAVEWAMPYVCGLVLLMMLSQFVINLANFAFNTSLDRLGVGDLVARKQYLSTCYVWINGFSVIVQLFVVAPLFQFVSQRVVHFMVPIIYLLAVGLGIGPAASAFGLGAAFVVIKGVDYSLFSTAKEIFYFHLSPAQKYGAKYLVDMVSYRLGKAIISLALLTEAWRQLNVVKIMLVVLLLIWPLLLWWIFAEQKKLAAQQEAK